MSVSKLEIQLERASGVYYAGEVVRGTVALETSGSKEVTCRNFRVRLQGRARVHWHTGSGDNRRDYDGSTLFQSQRHTLAGNFHRTALLDEAGEDADFEIVPYSGVMRIPCQGHEEQNLKLIVRVMDYDFGKRDDLLGEIVLDVPSLAQARQQQSFPLTRKGKPEKGEVTLSAKWLPFDAVFPTASRSGERVSMTQSMVLELTVHKATGLRKADWVGKNDVYCQVYRIPNGTTLNLSKALPVPSKEMKLPAGRTIYPFAFALRSDAPGSAELNVWDYAHVRYDVYANVDKAFWRDPSRKVTLTVIPNRPVPLPRLLTPVQRTLKDQVLHGMEVCCCKCGKIDGIVSMTFQLDRQSYAAGEPMKVTGTIESSVDIPLVVSVRLIMYVQMSTRMRSSHQTRHDTVLWSGELPANASDVSLSRLGLNSVLMPRTYPSFNGGVPVQVSPRHYACLRYTYNLEVCVEKKLKGGGGTSTTIPVLVAAAPPYASAVEAGADATPRELFDAVSPMAIFDWVLFGPANSATTPRLTGPEDGGVVVPADTAPTIINMYNPQEDSGTVGSNPPYVPYIHAVNMSSAAPVLPEKPVAAVEPVVASGGRVDSLLASLDQSFDRRLTVGEWVRDNPGAAAQLSPDQVGQILSKISFSMEQASVASEIAAGMENTDSLTCQHIRSAMQACPYAMAEVAQALAPTVRDPENKATVLELVDYSFERDTVSRAFAQ